MKKVFKRILFLDIIFVFLMIIISGVLNISYQQKTLIVSLFSLLIIFLIVLVVLLGNEYYKNKELNMKIEKLNFENSELKKGILTL